MLGFLAAAFGGLSIADLEELTGFPSWEVEIVLRASSGRTFNRRTSELRPGRSLDVYLLGHEELQAAAVRYLGRRLDGYREQLHAWADHYRIDRWPAQTPEYLLAGYYSLLVTLGDVARMTICASDAVRHDRMLDITGGDTAALAEIRTALDGIAAQDDPDLTRALVLSRYRHQITTRNSNYPDRLPSVWALTGNTVRAEALAASISDPHHRAVALAQVSEVLAGAENYRHAAILAGRAVVAARSERGAVMRAAALTAAAEALAHAGDHERAEAVARSISDTCWQAMALSPVPGALARAGQHQRAEALARSIGYPDCASGRGYWAGGRSTRGRLR